MIRRFMPLAALTFLFGACSSNAARSPQTAATSPDRTEGDAAPQGAGTPGRGGRRVAGGPREDMLMRGITLSSAQQRRVQEIRAGYRTQIEQAREEGGADRSATRDRVQALMEKQRAEVRAVLTAEQQLLYDRNVTEMRERMPRGGDRRPGRDASA